MSQRQAHWGEYLPQVKVVVAVEVEMWLVRWSDFQQRVGWDIRKRTDPQNVVAPSYFLNFVQLKNDYENYYRKLREYLVKQAKGYPQLKILCVPSEPKSQPQSKNWIS